MRGGLLENSLLYSIVHKIGFACFVFGDPPGEALDHCRKFLVPLGLRDEVIEFVGVRLAVVELLAAIGILSVAVAAVHQAMIVGVHGGNGGAPSLSLGVVDPGQQADAIEFMVG